MPHESAGVQCAELFVVGGRLDFLQHSFGRKDLVGPHDEEHVLSGENAIFRENVEE